MKKFLFPPIDNIVKALIILAAGAAVTVLENSPWVMAVFVILAFMKAVSDMGKISRFTSQIKYLKSGKKYAEATEDFNNGRNMLSGKVVAGERYIFGKKCGALIAYDDIRFAHVIIRKNYGYSKTLFVEIITLDSSRHKLCKLSATDENARAANEFMKELRNLAPKADVVTK